MEDGKRCDMCDCITDNNFIDKDVEDFDKLLQECKSKSSIPIDLTHIDSLEQSKVIEWLLINASTNSVANVNEVVKSCENITDKARIVQILTENGVTIKSKNSYCNHGETTALILATLNNEPDIIAWLAEHEASVDIYAINYNGTYMKPIEFAAENGHTKSMIRLINLGATIPSTLLSTAISNGHMHMVQTILANPLLMKEQSPIDALQAAFTNEHYDIVEYLFENEMHISDVPDYYNRNCLHFAAVSGRIEVMKWLLKHEFKLLDKNTSRETEFHIAVQHGHLNLMKWLVTKGADINERIIYGYTPLHIAAQNGKLDCVKYLVHMGANVDAKDRNGVTVLHCAANFGNLEIVQFLIEHGANNLLLDDKGNSVLHSAYKSLDVMKWLVEKGCGINTRNVFGKPVLTQCAADCLYSSTEWLLENGGNVNDVLNEAYAWLNKSSEKNDWSYLEMVLKYMKDINALHNGKTLLHTASINLEAVKIILKYKADINVSSAEGSTILHDSFSTPQLTELLIENGANVNVTDIRGNTPLHKLSSIYLEDSGLHKLRMTKLLVENGTDVNASDIHGNTPLHNLSSIHSEKSEPHKLRMIKLLVENSAYVNAVNKNSDTILHAAVDSSDLDVIQYLVEHGADVTALGYKNNSVLHSPASRGKWDIVQYLVSKGANINHVTQTSQPILCHALAKSNIDVTKWLIENGADCNSHAPTDCTPIHYIIGNTEESAIFYDLLIKHGADVNSISRSGMTVLFSNMRSDKNVDMLLRAGANVNVKSYHNDWSPLHYAVQVDHTYLPWESNESNATYDKYRYAIMQYMPNHTQEKVISSLLRYGADPNIKDDIGRTPLFYSLQGRKCNHIARVLVRNGADVNVKDIEGNSVLHIMPLCDLTPWFVENGADINHKNHSGQTVLHQAMRGQESHDTNTLIQIQKREISTKKFNCFESDILNSVSYARYLNAVEYVIDNSKDINERDVHGNTALNNAISQQNFDIFTLLIKKGAKTDLCDRNGNTILHLVSKDCDEMFLNYLLEKDIHKNILNCVNNNGETALHVATLSSQNGAIEKLLEANIDVTYKTLDTNTTALHIAALRGNLHGTKLLVKKGANIYEPDKNGLLPIQIAAENCKVDLIEYFVNLKPEFESTTIKLYDIKNKNNENLLHIATRSGKFNVVPNDTIKMLLKTNLYSIDATDNKGETVLHAACRTYMVDIVTMLVEKGGDVNKKNKHGDTPFHLASRLGSIDIINYLLEKGADMNIKNNEGNTPFHIAVANARYPVTRCFMQRGANLYARNKKGLNILHLAASSGGELFTEVLAEYSQDKINELSNKKETVLLLALKQANNKNNVKRLLEIQDINKKDIFGNTALHVACKKGKLDVVIKLLEMKAEIYAQNNALNTPLHIAVKESQFDIVCKLFPRYENLSLINKLCYSVIQEACLQNDVRIVQILARECNIRETCPANDCNLLHIAITNKDTALLIYLLQKCPDILNQCNTAGETVLHSCLKLSYHDINVVNHLINAGADMNIPVKDDIRNTCLHLATQYGRQDFVQYFIGKRLDINLTNKENNTSLHVASENGYLNIVKILCVNGADVNAIGFKGRTPLHMAADKNMISVARYLVQERNASTDIVDEHGFTALQLATVIKDDQEISPEWSLLL